MATFSKKKTGWRAEVCVLGRRASKTFRTRVGAKDWAAQKELELRQDVGDDVSFPELLDQYERRVSIHKPGHIWECMQFAKFRRCSFAGFTVRNINKALVSIWKDERLKSVSGSTVNREMGLLSNIFTLANEWGFCGENPCKGVRRPKNNPARDRRVTDSEIERLSLVAGFDGAVAQTPRQRIMAAFLFAIETAMRKGEILSLAPESVKGRVAHLPMTKNGTARDVPLSTRALALWEMVGGDFRLSENQIDGGYRIMCQKADITGLHFHDTRHEATTRLARKIDVMDLARMTGHTDLKMLMRYYNPTAEEIADRLV
jgi:integrase